MLRIHVIANVVFRLHHQRADAFGNTIWRIYGGSILLTMGLHGSFTDYLIDLITVGVKVT
jgi:hypothetical protein